MKPLKLTMRGFITYREEVVIDFTKLDGQGLFMISGPTGSGKTTIFDGICYALYGEVSTARRDAASDEELRCHYLEPTDPYTFVEFEFVHQSKRYAVRREPRQTAIKRSKRPATYVNEVALRELTADGDIFISESIREVNDFIINAVGLKKEQFTTVVLLPQGEFSTFLSADSKSKKEILGRIFATDNIAAFEQVIQRRASKATKELKDIVDEINLLVSQLDESTLGHLSDLVIDKSVDPIHYSDFVERLKDHNKQESDTLNLFRTKLSDKRRLMENQQMFYRDSQRNNEQLATYEHKNKRVSQLKLKEHVYIDLKDRLDQGIAAQGIQPYEEALIASSKELENVQQGLEKMRLELESAQTAHDRWLTRHKDLPDLKKGLEQDVAEVNKLNEDRRQLVNYEALLNQNKVSEEKVSTIKKKLTGLEKALRADAKKIEEMECFIENKGKLDVELREFSEKTLSQKEHLKVLASLFHKTKKVLEESDKIKCKETDILETKNNVLTMEKDLAAMLEGIKQDALSQYVNLLEEGKPCPLCGSIHHPNKLERTTHSSVEWYDALVEKHKQASKDLTQLERDHGIVLGIQSATIQEIQDEMVVLGLLERGMALTVDENLKNYLFRKGTEAKTDYEALERKKTEILLGLQRIEQTEIEVKKCRDRMDQLKEEMNKFSIEKMTETTSIENRKSQIDVIIASIERDSDIETIEKRLTEIASHKASIENEMEQISTGLQRATLIVGKLEAGLTVQSDIELGLIAKEAQLQKRLAEEIAARFEESDRYQTAKKDYVEIKDRAEDIEDYFKKLTSEEKELSVLQAFIEGLTYVDLKPIQDQVTFLDNEVKALEIESSNLALVNSSGEKILHLVESRTIHYATAVDNQKLLETLDRIMRGMDGGISGREKINFETFVLIYYFDQVLYYANQRLHSMTNGQYELMRKDEITSNQGKQGLDIDVLDTHTGRKRSSATLSGGESFLASLALSLGVSDAMMDNSGAVDVQMLLIDEGFGSLDEDALQNAIDCLLDLTENDRLIGIISHVDELKDQIPHKIVVTYEKERGSSLKMEVQ